MAMTLRLNEEDDRTLAELAASEGVSRQEATVRAIREAAARRGHEVTVRQFADEAIERYRTLLDRLGR